MLLILSYSVARLFTNECFHRTKYSLLMLLQQVSRPAVFFDTLAVSKKSNFQFVTKLVISKTSVPNFFSDFKRAIFHLRRHLEQENSRLRHEVLAISVLGEAFFVTPYFVVNLLNKKSPMLGESLLVTCETTDLN